MKVLVIGSGGREHALVWKLAQSPRVSRIFCAPGNDGIGNMAEIVPLAVDDLDGLLSWAKQEAVDLTVVGPEIPLTLGIVDRFREAGLRIFGPSMAAAQLEGSKAFAKDLMWKYGIPTAEYRVFGDAEEAKAYVYELGAPVVVKADGLAAGKGVVVAHDIETAIEAVEQMMEMREFGDAGGRIVIEEFLQGVELSLLTLVDGKTALPMAPAHDHKAAYDGDQGPNTGGMGAFSPSHVADSTMLERIQREVLEPTVAAMAQEGARFEGVLFAGLMLTATGPKVLEFNARFGDPETQVVLPRLENDLVEVMEAVIDGTLAEQQLIWKEESAVTVILAAGGYPMAYEKGHVIEGLHATTGQVDGADAIVFHAGTRCVDGTWLTNGGRVLAVTALGGDFAEAQQKAYRVVEQIQFPGKHVRTDIGEESDSSLNRMKGVNTMEKAMVGIIMGSDSDLSIMKDAAVILEKLGVTYEMSIISAHRTPERAEEYARTAAERGVKVIIAGAGKAAHLAGVLAAFTPLPIIGVPILTSSLSGADSLYSMVQMPNGVPVAVVALNGATNAGILAAQMIATGDLKVREAIVQYKEEMKESVNKQAEKLERLGYAAYLAEKK